MELQETLQPVNWPEVRALAMVVGVREAARRMGISVEATMKRSQRENWLATVEAQQAVKHAHLNRTCEKHSPRLSAASILAQELKDLGSKSRISLARGLAKGAAHVEQLDPENVLADAQNVKSLVQSTSIIHGWQNQSPSVSVHLAISGHDASLPTVESEAVEAEWRESQLPEAEVDAILDEI